MVVPIAAHGRAVHGLETLVLEDGARPELGRVAVHLAPLAAGLVADALSLGPLLGLDLHAGRARRHILRPPPGKRWLGSQLKTTTHYRCFLPGSIRLEQGLLFRAESL